MSFVSNLRMRNLFPMNSNLGSARPDLSGEDPMNEIINAYNMQRQNESQFMASQPNGLRTVGNAGRSSTLPEPLRFGGVTQQSNPGADILARSRKSAEDIYKSYGEPINPQIEGPSRDDIAIQRSFDNSLKTKTVDSNISQNERRIGNEEKRLDQADQRIDKTGWTIGMVNDPVNPGKQISVRINSDGRVEPIKMGETNVGTISKPGTNKGSLIQPKNLDAIRASTQEALNQLDEIIDDQGNFSEQGGSAVGWSALGNKIPFTDNKAGSNSILRLKSLLVKDLIGEMKAQSRTGATGYGALNLGELNLLKQGADKLDTMTDEETFRTEAKRIREKLMMILQDDVSTPVGKNGMRPVSSHSSSNDTAPQSPKAGWKYVRNSQNNGWTPVKDK